MAAAYQVTAVNQFQRIGEDGHLEDWADATFNLVDYSATGSAQVVMTGDWQSALAEAIQAKADELEAFMAAQP
jgi:hypothetical protein